MNLPSNESPAPARTGFRLIAVVVCLAGAFGAALFLKYHEQPPSAAVVLERPQSPEDILATIPVPTGNSASEQAQANAIAKARANGSKPEVWLNLGDALAQRLRDSTDQTYFNFAESAYRQALRLHSNSKITPINEWEEIKKGNMAVAVIMAAVIIGAAFVIGLTVLP